MVNKNFLSSLNVIFSSLKDNIKEIYQCSNFYEKKISKVFDSNFEYKPSPYLLSSIVKYQKKKISNWRLCIRLYLEKQY